MDYIAIAPLNAKGTCFRIVVAEPAAASKTPKHIKTKKNWELVVCFNKGEYVFSLWREILVEPCNLTFLSSS